MKSIINRRGSKAATRALKRLGTPARRSARQIKGASIPKTPPVERNCLTCGAKHTLMGSDTTCAGCINHNQYQTKARG